MAACYVNPAVCNVAKRGDTGTFDDESGSLNIAASPSYQQYLRALGAFFDSSEANGVSVIETRDGFMARYYTSTGGEEVQARPFATTDLMQGRGTSYPRVVTSDLDARPETSYQNVLRALGWELDDVAAAAITIDELPGEFYVSWLARRPDDGAAVVKRHASVGHDELQSILRDAEGRRIPSILSAGGADDEVTVFET